MPIALFILLLAAFVGECIAFGPNSFLDRRHRYRIQTALSVTKSIVVVGGGVGGLAVASRIAAAGKNEKDSKWQVTILEKNECIGGRCGSFQRRVDQLGTFRHERGPSLLLLPRVYKDVFRDCTKDKAEDFGLTMKQCIPAYQVVFEDGDSIDVGYPRQPTERMSQAELQSRQKMNSYEKDGALKWDEYMRATSAFLDAGLSNFIEERLDLLSLPNFLVEALRDFAKVRASVNNIYVCVCCVSTCPWNTVVGLAAEASF